MGCAYVRIYSGFGAIIGYMANCTKIPQRYPVKMMKSAKILPLSALAVAFCLYSVGGGALREALAQSDNSAEEVANEIPLRIEVPKRAPDAESEARRSAYAGCTDWATATLESERQIESDRGLGSILGADYQAFHDTGLGGDPNSRGQNVYEERWIRMIDRCMRDRDSEIRAREQLGAEEAGGG